MCVCISVGLFSAFDMFFQPPPPPPPRVFFRKTGVSLFLFRASFSLLGS